MNSQTDSSIIATHSFLRQRKLFERLLNSSLFQSYKELFQSLTGLPLELHSMNDDEVTACQGSVNQNRFCQLLNKGGKGCQGCLLAQHCLESTQKYRVQSIACFAGLQETAVPIMVDSVMVAQLKTGQIFHEKPNKEDFKKVAEVTGMSGTELEDAYLATPVIKKPKYQSMVTLLAAFSLQLTKLANQIKLEQGCEEKTVLEKVKDYIDENIFEPILLDEIAEEFDMSRFYFCRKFKEMTGMTLTGYVTEQRVGFAKDELIGTDRKVTDIAFDSGFQSLSQFNRSFHTLTGFSPTDFRKRAA